MTAAALARAALAAVLAAGTLGGCGGDDNPIPAPARDAPIGSTPVPTPSPSVDGTGPTASAVPTATTPPVPGGTVVRGADFTIVLPGSPEQSQATGPSGSRITFDIYRYEAGPEVYTVTRGYYPKIGTLPLLKEAIDSAADQVGGKLATSRTFKYQKMPCIEGTITGVKDKGQEVTIFARYVVVGRVMYGLLYLYRGNVAPNLAFKTYVESLTFTG
ncbi:MAG TPA: hypothetical protein VMZ00_07485 [Sporichthya sp.]|nr:hypothetical protein [Sporichthya sp.]